MDVIVQRMVTPHLAGVAFSRNPLTGLNEVVIEAVEGAGEALVGEGRTPLRWIWRGGSFTHQPEISGENDRVAERVSAEVIRLSRAYGRPADIEWAFDGRLWFLQIRPITGLQGAVVYSNRISREVMPGLVTPLVWSINVPVVNGAWIRLIERAVGPSGLKPFDLARKFGCRSYFNMTAMGRVFELMGLPHDSLEIMLGLPNTPRPQLSVSSRTIALFPRMFALLIWLNSYGNRVGNELPPAQRIFEKFATTDLADMTDRQLRESVDRLLVAIGKTAEINIVVPLLANLYAAGLRRAIAGAGMDPAQIDITAGAASPFDPLPHLHQLRLLARELGIERNLDPTNLPPRFLQAFRSFLDRFGHFSDSGNDLSVAPWRETPEKLLKMVEMATPRRPISTRLSLSDVRSRCRSPLRKFVLSFLWRRARAFQEHRDAVSSIYTFGYGLLRPMFIELGRRLASRRVISEPEDVMFLSLDEIDTGLASGASAIEFVKQRHEEYAAAASLVLPEVIYGDNFTPMPASAHSSELSGVGSSRGQHRGILRVLRNLDDFPRVRPGDIIVIPYSDVGWTPAFAHAGAVVSEAGGMLSHSSIVAREYGIPCVVSVERAMSLPDGAEAVVDGSRGKVVVLGGRE